jgi:thioredoxin-like negative regulator of GroEL
LIAFDRAAAMNQDVATINAKYGAALVRAGRLLDARPRLELAAQALPNRPRIACDLAEVLLGLREPEVARGRLETAIGFSARDTRAHELLERCLRELGDASALSAEQARWVRVR